MLRLEFLGTGTSKGIPEIGCGCGVCLSTDPRDKRLRTSVLVSYLDTTCVIDVGPDFRQQMLRSKVGKLNAALITHEHNDHIIGMDDIRPYNFLSDHPMRVYSSAPVAKEIKERFRYVFSDNPYPGAPKIELVHIEKNKSFQVGELDIMPMEVMHGRLPVLGFVMKDVAYITDAKTVANDQYKYLKDLKVLVINALHRSPHKTHFNLDEALEFIEEIQPERAYLTHISHRMGKHEEVQSILPKNVNLAYDGLYIEID